ncbi:hypothetical protein M433DRAFT_134441 [Acidomyces richmondensis BFW]|nr:MAG: hypothetical protein FE78DRAFT_103774 [Acidomyces sp. 'richmondensis']KYG45744.1 hypothetical protein M433DRAFT_134441 [Acidomyces richmondensis BFW]
MGFPIIDICNIDAPDAQLSIAKEITDASKTWGFLLLKNHPIPLQDIQNMFDIAHQFFTLPPSEKDFWPINNNYVGYNAPLSDRKQDDKASMWLSGKPGHLQSSLTSLPPFWHKYLEEVEKFKHDCHGLVIKLLVCFALAMDLPDRYYFAKAHAEDAGNGNQFRLLWYPPRDDKPFKTTTRMSAHSDSGSVTLLFQTVSGLEVESPNGNWVPAPQIDGHILVNLGDALAFWSGGQLKATRHRVTFEGVPHNRERISMAYFGAASPDTVLEPLGTFCDTKALKNYNANGVLIQPGITVGEYGRRVMENIYGNHVEHSESTAAVKVA